jgi:hypothetical protein
MDIFMKNKKGLIIGISLLILGLVASLYLVIKIQEIRKGAAFTSNTLYFQPSGDVNKKLGEEVSLGVFLAAVDARKVDFVQTKICYGGNLVLTRENINSAGVFKIVEDGSLKVENNCLSLTVTSDKGSEELPSGQAIQIATLKFITASTGSGKIDFVQSESYASGPNSDISQIKINVDEVRNLNYVIETPIVPVITRDKINLSFASSDTHTPSTVSQRVGTKFGTDLMVDSGSRKVDIIQIKFCYNDVLQADLSEITVGEKFTDVVLKKDLGNNCVELVVKAEKEESQLPSGEARIAIVYFNPLKVGSGTFTYDTSYSYASGPNTDVNMMKMIVGSASSKEYIISSVSAPTLTPAPTLIPTSTPTLIPTSTPTLIPTSTPTPTPTPTIVVPECTNGVKECVTSTSFRECVNSNWGAAVGCSSAKPLCVDGVCQPKASVDSNFTIKLAFAGVKPNNDQCVSDWSTTLRLVDSSGITFKEITGIPQKTDGVNSKGEIVYSLTGTVSDVPDAGFNDLSFFVKGYKHLSLKYGVDNQTSWYNSFAGQLKLQNGTNNYNFSKYSLLAGDVTGSTIGEPDGKIDARDFSFIKEKSQPITEVAEGSDLVGDIDGNCQVNSGDVRLIKESLIEINGQIY